MAFARRQFELSQPQEDGQPLIAHLQLVQKRTGKVDELIATAPTLPEGLETLWSAFNELHRSRGSTGWGHQRILLTDFEAFQRLEWPLTAWQRRLIRDVDDLWMSEFAPKPKGDK